VGSTGVPMPPTPSDEGSERWWMFPEEDTSGHVGTGGLKSSPSLTSLGLGAGLSSSFSLSNLGLGLGLCTGKEKKDDSKDKDKDKDRRNGMFGRLRKLGRKSIDDKASPVVTVLDDAEAFDKMWNGTSKWRQ
jgi:hypothetical protein